MNSALNEYRESRDGLLLKITEILSRDERFVAGWLTGSFSRNEEDAVSDIDITLVVAGEYSTELCQRLEQISGQTIPERFSLFSQFERPTLLHENNNNAPAGGTFTFVLYSQFALMVDWILIPLSKATRPHQSRLLFDKVGIPVSPAPQPEALEQRKKFVAEKWAFFWMMTAVTIKYIIREDRVFAMQWIENLHSLIQEIEGQMDGKSWEHHRGSFSQLQPNAEKQIESLIQLCRKMQELKPKVAEFTETDPLMPSAEIEFLFSLANQEMIVNPKL